MLPRSERLTPETRNGRTLSSHELSGLVWWIVGMALATGYFVFIYRMFRGKVVTGEGH